MIKKKLHPDLKYLFMATLFFGSASAIFISTLNNYLTDVHALNASSRGWLEFPRELPGFLIIFVSAGLLTYMRESRMAAFAMFLTATGALGLGFVARDTELLVLFIIVWSLGDHIIFAVEGPLGLNLANHGAEGRRLGQLGGARNLGSIMGVGVIYFLAKLYGDRYDLFYLVAATSALLAGVCYLQIQAGKGTESSKRMVFKKKYRLFYAISALFGVRKQIFLAFGGWVLVQIYQVPVSTIALLYFIAATLGVLMRPLLGDVIDWVGERVILTTDEALLLLICLTYAFAGDVFSHDVARNLLFGAYIFDSILFALRIARTTYLKKIVDHPRDITPTIAMGITFDHAVAMTLPILSGYIWDRFGFRWVFIMAGAIAVIGFFVCLNIPSKNALTQMAKANHA